MLAITVTRGALVYTVLVTTLQYVYLICFHKDIVGVDHNGGATLSHGKAYNVKVDDMI
jgi:hypothetical protein